MVEQDLVERIRQYMPNGNPVLATHLARLFDEYTQNGMPASADAFDLDQILGDSHLKYLEKKSRLIEALRNSGFISEEQMRIDEGVRYREETKLINKNDKEKKEELAIAESEETKARFNQALDKIASSENLDKVLYELVPEMKRFGEYLDMSLNGTYNNGMIVTGPAGTAKTHKILSELKKRNLPFELYNSHTSALSLFEILYINKKNIVVLDDLEALLQDKRSVGILKAASFSATGVREVTWNSTAKVLAERGLPNRFVFDGKILIISNEEYKTRNPSFKALVSRMPVYRVNLSMDARKILVHSVIMKENMYELKEEEKKKLLGYMESLLNYSRADNYNLRTAIRACEIYKMRGDEGLDLIAELMDVDEDLRKFLLIEDKAGHLPVAKRRDIWKEYTGYSTSSYHLLKTKYYSDKYESQERLEKELEEINALIEEKEKEV